MTDAERMDNVILRAVEAVKAVAPVAKKHGGNLRDFGVKSKKISFTESDIYVEEQEAPYMKYTNENWSKFRPPLFGKQNPNEGWWKRAADAAAKSIARDLGGTIQ